MNRLYQADWLMRFYGFEADEITAGGKDGNLDLAIDPKLAWALAHRASFPVDVNRAGRVMLLRVPGFLARGPSTGSSPRAGPAQCAMPICCGSVR